MVQVDVTHISGIGWLRAFRTGGGERIAVLTLHSGRRQLSVEDPQDPDSSQLVAELGVVDSHVLAELLGGPLLEPRADATTVAALLDWVHIPAGAAADEASIDELGRMSIREMDDVEATRFETFFGFPIPTRRATATGSSGSDDRTSTVVA